MGVQEKQDEVEWDLVVFASKPSASRDDRGDQVKEQGERKTCGLKLGVEVERSLRRFTSGSPQNHWRFLG